MLVAGGFHGQVPGAGVRVGDEHRCGDVAQHSSCKQRHGMKTPAIYTSFWVLPPSIKKKSNCHNK